MKHLATLSINRVLNTTEVIQVKVEVGVTVDHYEEESVAFEELRVPAGQSVWTQ
jgi:hypothetical protein